MGGVPPPNPPGLLESKTSEEAAARSLGLKDLQLKSLKINKLNCQIALKIGLGRFRGPSLIDGYTSEPPQSDLYRHAQRVLSQWISITGGCDEQGERRPATRSVDGTLSSLFSIFGRLHQFWDAGDCCGIGRLEIELLDQEGDPVAAGCGVQGVGRVINL